MCISYVFITIGTIPAFAEVDAKTHKLCLEAKDYLGCVKAHESTSTKATTADDKTELDGAELAKTRTKEFYRKIHDFNRKRFIAQNPQLAKWVEEKPALARKAIARELHFFSQEDYKIADTDIALQVLCMRRAKEIDESFYWLKPCEEASISNTATENNRRLQKAIDNKLAKDLLEEIEEYECKKEGKEIVKFQGDSERYCLSKSEIDIRSGNSLAEAADEMRRRMARLEREKQRSGERGERRLKVIQAILNGLKGVTDNYNQRRPVSCFSNSTTFGNAYGGSYYGSTVGSTNCY